MILLLVIDSIWVLGASRIHMNVIEDVQKSKPQINPLAALLFYVLAPIGYIVITKKLVRTSEEAFLYGALLGLLMYGTFDLTNKAIFTDYPWTYTIADMTWGTLCVGIVSSITFNLK